MHSYITCLNSVLLTARRLFLIRLIPAIQDPITYPLYFNTGPVTALEGMVGTGRGPAGRC